MQRILFTLLALATTASAIDLKGDFKGPLGLQLYSLRETFKTDPTAALDRTKALGFQYAEVYAAIRARRKNSKRNSRRAASLRSVRISVTKT